MERARTSRRINNTVYISVGVVYSCLGSSTHPWVSLAACARSFAYRGQVSRRLLAVAATLGVHVEWWEGLACLGQAVAVGLYQVFVIERPESVCV